MTTPRRGRRICLSKKLIFSSVPAPVPATNDSRRFVFPAELDELLAHRWVVALVEGTQGGGSSFNFNSIVKFSFFFLLHSLSITCFIIKVRRMLPHHAILQWLRNNVTSFITNLFYALPGIRNRKRQFHMCTISFYTTAFCIWVCGYNFDLIVFIIHYCYSYHPLSHQFPFTMIVSINRFGLLTYLTCFCRITSSN